MKILVEQRVQLGFFDRRSDVEQRQHGAQTLSTLLGEAD
jgi:hypothetical protein